jgi:hypothetical protein
VTKVSIEIDSKWVKRVHSPLFSVVATLQGVAVTFAPMFLFWSGKGMFHNHWSEWIIASMSFASIFLVGWFYVRLGSAVVGELRKKNLPIS